MARPYRVPFEARIDSGGGPDGCWPWTGARTKKGYGVLWQSGRLVYAHRRVLSESLGRPLAPGENALHHCDNPPCCNPTHLYPGAQAQNARDAAARGRLTGRRHCSGETSPLAKLTWADVVAARTRHLSGEGVTPLAREFGVHRDTMRLAITGKTWAHSG